MAEHHETTRKIYHEQHKRLSADESAKRRIVDMYSEKYFGLGDNWFRGKKVFDAGCGNIASLMIRMAQFGAEKVYGMDVGEEWIPLVREEMRKSGISEDSYVLRAGNVLDIPFADGTFNFVSCNGVLIHLRDLEEVRKGFRECSRVCAGGGVLYTSFGVAGGLFEEAVFPAMRRYYSENKEFKQLIDNINPSMIHDLFSKIESDIKIHTGEDADLSFLKPLIDEEWCVFWQNALQPPTRYMVECSPEFVEKLYRENGYKEIRRLKRYVTRYNIRKFFAPLHYDLQHPISKILYGNGSVEYIARKY